MSSKIPTDDQLQTLSDRLHEQHSKLWEIVERTELIQELIELEEDCQRAQQIINRRLEEVEYLLQNGGFNSNSRFYYEKLT